MKLLQELGLIFCLYCALSQASIYPDGEDKESWDARINAKIDELHKRDVTLKVALSTDELVKSQAGKLRLRVNQTRTPIPFGKDIINQSSRIHYKHDMLYLTFV